MTVTEVVGYTGVSANYHHRCLFCVFLCIAVTFDGSSRRKTNEASEPMSSR